MDRMSRLFSPYLRSSLRRTSPIASSSRLVHTARRPSDFPFKPPPIRERLRPLIPFFIWWTVLTSLTVHLLRARQSSTEADRRSSAKITALQDLLGRVMAGEEISEGEVQRRLEMVGVRERPKIEAGPGVREEVRDVGWREAIFGRKMVVNEKEDEEEVRNWARSVVAEATESKDKPSRILPPDTTPAGVVATVRRAPSSNRYM